MGPPDRDVVPHLRRANRESEDVFSDAFLARQDAVLNALDSVAARMYVDGRCVQNGRPLLESKTNMMRNPGGGNNRR